jgi:hypothetical protein
MKALSSFLFKAKAPVSIPLVTCRKSFNIVKQAIVKLESHDDQSMIIDPSPDAHIGPIFSLDSIFDTMDEIMAAAHALDRSSGQPIRQAFHRCTFLGELHVHVESMIKHLYAIILFAIYLCDRM